MSFVLIIHGHVAGSVGSVGPVGPVEPVDSVVLVELERLRSDLLLPLPPPLLPLPSTR